MFLQNTLQKKFKWFANFQKKDHEKKYQKNNLLIMQIIPNWKLTPILNVPLSVRHLQSNGDIQCLRLKNDCLFLNFKDCHIWICHIKSLNWNRKLLLLKRTKWMSTFELILNDWNDGQILMFWTGSSLGIWNRWCWNKAKHPLHHPLR